MAYVSGQDRAVASAGVAAVVAGVGAMLLAALAGPVLVRHPAEVLASFDVVPPPPPPAERPTPPHRHSLHRDAPAPPARRAAATPVVAPPPPAPVPPPPVVAAPVAGTGAAPSQGAALAGPGTGAGGRGDGRGAGGTGDGDETPLQLISGPLRVGDLPDRLLRARAGGTVAMRWTVTVKGRATGCTVTRSSGDAELDAATCRLVERRLRYRPTLDASGRPVPDTVNGTQEWDAREDAGADE